MYKMFQECSQKGRRQRGLVKDKTLCRLICSSTVNAFMWLVPFLSPPSQKQENSRRD